MFSCAGFGYGFWWIFPVIMIVMMALCFFLMRGRMGAMMCRPRLRSTDGHGEDASPELELTKKADKGLMKRDSMGNQRGEVVIGVMMVIMCVVMLFGGMHMMHGGHGHAAGQDGRIEDKQDHGKEGLHHPQNDGESNFARSEDPGTQK